MFCSVSGAHTDLTSEMVLGSKGKAAVVHWAPLILQNSHPDQPVIAQLQESLQKSLHRVPSIALCHHAF